MTAVERPPLGLATNRRATLGTLILATSAFLIVTTEFLMVGLLPGLELVGRLAYEGDLDCNLYFKPCAGGQRDLSVSAKYQLPIELPLDTRLAVGFTDYGGAATNYRSYYGVATSTWGPLDLSLGYGRPKSASALLDGGFGSVVLRLDDHWAAALEHDSREARLGLNYLRPLTSDLAGGSLDLAVLSPTAAQPFLQSGRIVPLAVTSAQRLSALPQVPAMAELAPLRGYELVGWFALMAPRALPADTAQRITAALQEALAEPAVRKRLEDAGMVPATGREDLARLIAEEDRKYEQLAAFAKMRD